MRRADSDSQVLLLHLGLLDPEDAAAAWKQIDPWFESGNWPFPFGFEGAEVCHGPMYGLHLDSSLLSPEAYDYMLAACKSCKAEVVIRAVGAAELPIVKTTVSRIGSRPKLVMVGGVLKKARTLIPRGSVARAQLSQKQSQSSSPLVIQPKGAANLRGPVRVVPPEDEDAHTRKRFPEWMVARRRKYQHLKLEQYKRHMGQKRRVIWSKYVGREDLPEHLWKDGCMPRL